MLVCLGAIMTDLAVLIVLPALVLRRARRS
jgi:hypothetical protein